MLKRICLFLLSVCLWSVPQSVAQTATGSPAGKLHSPSEFLPHEWGTQFTPHHLLVSYFEHVAANSNRVMLEEYGRTTEGRPQLLAIVSSPANLARIEEIRQSNLRRAGLLPSSASGAEEEPIAIVWLGHSVHGNEAAGSESALQTVFHLANPENRQAQQWLENTVVLLDPSLNPDGYDRYTHWYRSVNNQGLNPSPDDIEHQEPWPGGRTNHYFFDLNRDWAWQTQQESINRMRKYQSWMPHVNADIHEQGVNSPYYFAPAARPYHDYITDWQADFQTEIGRNHMKYFDENGWLYFTREVFDLLYPSYADTYSTFNGAIGMTYEQGGSGRAGRAVDMENGDTLTLLDRVKHHHTAALSTIEISADNAGRLVQAFDQYFKGHADQPVGRYKSYIVKRSNPRGSLQAFAELLDKNQIQYSRIEEDKKTTGYHYQTGEEGEFDIVAGDMLISAHQPLSVLVQVLFEPQTALEDSLTYDITAWSIPYAYGLQAYAVEDKMDANQAFSFPEVQNDFSQQRDPYAYIMRWQSVKDLQLLAALMKKNIRLRTASQAFTIDGRKFDPGTLIATRADNRKMGNLLDQTLQSVAQKMDTEVLPVFTGNASRGYDLGSGKMDFLEKPKILVLTDEGTFSQSYGQIWYYFEQVINYPITRSRAESFGRVDLGQYNTIILPEGSYDNLDKDTFKELKVWVRNGGKLIAIGRAVPTLVDKMDLELKKNKTEDDEEQQKEDPIYGNQVRDYISGSIPGAIYKLNIDNTHPLGYGFPDYYFSVKTGTTAYKKSDEAWNVGYVDEKPFFLGFVGSRVAPKIENSTIFGVDRIGRGEVVFMIDNPLFRGFWHQGLFLFGNAVFMVGS